MNIAFLLTPKGEIVTLRDTMTIRQAMEKMEYHKYSAVPVIDDLGRYIYTLSEGDILWYIKEFHHLDLKACENISIDDIPRSRVIEAVHIDKNIEQVIDLTRYQNFVPVTDDLGTFIGIVKRSNLMVSNLYLHPTKVLLKGKPELLQVESKGPDYVKASSTNYLRATEVNYIESEESEYIDVN